MFDLTADAIRDRYEQHALDEHIDFLAVNSVAMCEFDVVQRRQRYLDSRIFLIPVSLPPLSAGMPFVVVIGVMLMNSLVSAFMYCEVITFIKAFIS